MTTYVLTVDVHDLEPTGPVPATAEVRLWRALPDGSASQVVSTRQQTLKVGTGPTTVTLTAGIAYWAEFTGVRGWETPFLFSGTTDTSIAERWRNGQLDPTGLQPLPAVPLLATAVAAVQAQLTAILQGAPGAYDTFLEVATQFGLDEATVTALQALVAGKAPLASPALTGTPTAPTVAGSTDSSTTLATTAFVQAVATALGTSVAATYATNDRRVFEVYDEFSRYGNIASAAGLTPLIGPAWQASGGGIAIVSGHAQAPSTSVGYLWQALTGTPAGMACEVVWSGSGTNLAMTMAFSGGTTLSTNDLAPHMNFGPTGFTLTVRKDGGSFDTLLSAPWKTPMFVDGVTVYRIALRRRGNTVIIDGPNGEEFAVTDPRISAIAGHVAFWEPLLSGSLQASLVSAGAYSAGTTGPYSLLAAGGELAGGGSTQNIFGSTSGNRATAYEVTIGYDQGSNLAGVTFGNLQPILTTSTVALAIGATTITTDQYIPSGATIQIETGNNAETVTASAASSGSQAPYTTPISATTKTHAAYVGCTATTSSSTWARIFNNAGVLNFPGEVMFHSTVFFDGFTADLTQPASGVIASHGYGTGKGAFRAGVVATVDRPAAAAVGTGSQMYDSTLSKPIWSDGTVWRDAAGTTV